MLLEQAKILILKQPAAAIDHEIVVNLGWRPAMVHVLNAVASGYELLWCDGTTNSGIKRGGTTAATQAWVATADGDAGVTPWEHGFILGKDTDVIKKNSAVLVVKCYRNLSMDVKYSGESSVQPSASNPELSRESLIEEIDLSAITEWKSVKGSLGRFKVETTMDHVTGLSHVSKSPESLSRPGVYYTDSPSDLN